MPGTLFVVATPIGNLEDVSARALRVLREASVIAAEDTRRTAQLLARYAITTPTTSLHEHNERKKSAALVERLTCGENVALVSDAGTPTVSDPGEHLIRSAIEAGIRIEPIPGPSAVLSALTASGLPAETFAFLGFPPVRSKDRAQWFTRLQAIGGTIVFFEAPHRIESTLRQLQALVGNQPVCVAREITKAHEEWVRGPIGDVIKLISSPKGEFTVVVNIDQITEQDRPGPASDSALLTEIGHITDNEHVSRRRAITTLARRHNMPPNEVYAAVERAKKLGK